MRNRTIVEQAQGLYQSGKRKFEIAKELGQSTSNISRWCRESPGIYNQKEPTNHFERKRNHLYSLDKLRVNSLDQNTAKTLLSIFYWCEGAKYPGSNTLEFVSSDERMQTTFIKLFRLAFKGEIDEGKFRVFLQLHTTHDVKSSIGYWSKLLHIPEKQFIKPHITIKKGGRYRKIYNGTCGLRYHDYSLLIRIMGCYDQVSKQITHSLI